jgi:methylmalonate-semialdehyde dehydrogenase [acylating] (EC 1.2.1.27)
VSGSDVGNLGVNAGTATSIALSHFDGRKKSFFGDLDTQGENIIRFYTNKTVYIERWSNA